MSLARKSAQLVLTREPIPTNISVYGFPIGIGVRGNARKKHAWRLIHILLGADMIRSHNKIALMKWTSYLCCERVALQ